MYPVFAFILLPVGEAAQSTILFAKNARRGRRSYFVFAVAVVVATTPATRCPANVLRSRIFSRLQRETQFFCNRCCWRCLPIHVCSHTHTHAHRPGYASRQRRRPRPIRGEIIFRIFSTKLHINVVVQTNFYFRIFQLRFHLFLSIHFACTKKPKKKYKTTTKYKATENNKIIQKLII